MPRTNGAQGFATNHRKRREVVFAGSRAPPMSAETRYGALLEKNKAFTKANRARITARQKERKAARDACERVVMVPPRGAMSRVVTGNRMRVRLFCFCILLLRVVLVPEGAAA